MTVMNIFIDTTTKALAKLFWLLTGRMNVIDEAKPIINMKSEFIYRRILLTYNKKNYAGLVTGELGKLLDKPVLDVKGLPILKKTNVPLNLRKHFSEVVENDILKTKQISIKNIINKYDDAEDKIKESLESGKVEYLLPKKIKDIEKYDLPERQEPIRGMIVWNALEPENQIVPPDNVSLIKLNCMSMDDPRLEELKTTHPDKYDIIMQTVFNIGVQNPRVDISKYGFTSLVLPIGVEEIPEYIRPFIDYKKMVDTNMKSSHVLLASLGIYIEKGANISYKSNIVEI